MELQSRIKRYFSFSSNEVVGLIMAVLITAFIVSFNEWGVDKFDVSYGLVNLMNSVIIVGVVLLIKISVEKIEALRRGYDVKWKMNLAGLIGGLILVFITNGGLFVLVPGSMAIGLIKRLRLGKFRYGLNRFEVGLVAFGGVLATLGMAVLFKALAFISPGALLDKAVNISLLLTIFSILPIPYLEGYRIWLGSRLLYFFCLGLVIGLSALFYLTSFVTAVFGAIGVAVLIWVLYYILFERNF